VLRRWCGSLFQIVDPHTSTKVFKCCRYRLNVVVVISHWQAWYSFYGILCQCWSQTNAENRAILDPPFTWKFPFTKVAHFLTVIVKIIIFQTQTNLVCCRTNVNHSFPYQLRWRHDYIFFAGDFYVTSVIICRCLHETYVDDCARELFYNIHCYNCADLYVVHCSRGAPVFAVIPYIIEKYDNIQALYIAVERSHGGGRRSTSGAVLLHPATTGWA